MSIIHCNFVKKHSTQSSKNEQSRFPFTRRLVGMDNTFIRCRSIAYRMHRQFVCGSN